MPEDKSIDDILADRALKVKEKVSSICLLLLNNKIQVEHLIKVAARSQNDVNKANLIESMEQASKINPAIISKRGFEFAIENLKSDASRIKWESAKVIANTAHLFPKLFKKAASNLLVNTEHSGNIVRWSAAGALSKIIECETSLNKELIPAIEAIEKREKDNAIKKIYKQVLKRLQKKLKQKND